MSISFTPQIVAPFRPTPVALPRFGTVSQGPSVLLVNDMRVVLRGVSDLLTEFITDRVQTAMSYDEALAAFDGMDPKPDYVLLDFNLGGERHPNGVAIAKALLEKGFPPERIIFVSNTHFDTIQDAMRIQGIPPEHIPEAASNLLEAAETGKIRVPHGAPGLEEFEACLKPLS